MTCTKLACAEHCNYVVGEVKKTEGVCNSTSSLSYLKRNLFLCEIVALDKRPVSLSLFNRIKILTLNVFNKRNLRYFKVVLVQNDYGHFCKTCHFRCTVSAFTRNYLVVTVGNFAHQNRLKYAVYRDRVSKLCKSLTFKYSSRLVCLRFNLRNAEFCNTALLFYRIVIKNIVKAFSKARGLLCHRIIRPLYYYIRAISSFATSRYSFAPLEALSW